jgi:hypothetical protein
MIFALGKNILNLILYCKLCTYEWWCILERVLAYISKSALEKGLLYTIVIKLYNDNTNFEYHDRHCSLPIVWGVSDIMI